MHLIEAVKSRSALVVGTAVVVVIGLWTVPTVASHLVVRSTDIVNGQVKTPDLGSSAVTKPKLAPNAKAMWAIVDTTVGVSGAGVIVAQSGGISVVDPTLHNFVGQRLHFPRSVQGKAIIATPITSAMGSPTGAATVKVAPCGPSPVLVTIESCGSPGSPNELLAIAHLIGADGGQQQAGVDYYIVVMP